MAPTISQNLAVPAALVAGGAISATHITPLFTAMNAFNIPSTVGGLQQALVDTVATTIATGASADFTITATKDKAILAVMSFTWLGSTSAALQFRLNTTSITASTVVATATTGGGLIFAAIGGHDATFLHPALFLIAPNDGSAVKLVAANTTLPNADYTSLGVAVAGAGATVNIAYKLVLNQG